MMKPIEYYIHIPFCVRKCRYCDFLSFAAEESVQSEYIEKLCEDIKSFDPFQEYEISTIFLGGGTPSILTTELMEKLMDSIYQNHAVRKDAEITIETNPGTLDREKLECYRSKGINRLSMGVQSFQDKELKLLGRIHNSNDVYDNFESARKAGFQNINLDLMSALPGQSKDMFLNNLKEAIALKPEHISAYSLIIEEGTPFYEQYGKDELRKEEGEQPLYLPSEEEDREIYTATGEYLKAYGYHRYEISNYAMTGKECRHNIGYWDRSDYMGFGLGASSMISNVRFSNQNDMEKYLNGNRENLKEILTIRQQMEETMFLGLRMMKGVEKERFCKDFGVNIKEVYEKEIKKMIFQGLLQETNERIFLTEKGIDLANYVMSEFIQ